MPGPNVSRKFASVSIRGVVFVGWVAAFNYKSRIGVFVRLGDSHIHYVEDHVRVSAGTVDLANLRRFDLHKW